MGKVIEELEKIQFSKTMNGYTKKEVEVFQGKVFAEIKLLERKIEDLERENKTHGEKIKHYKSLERTMQNSIEIAQKTLLFSQSQSEKTKTQADRDADHIISRAHEQAKAILEYTNEKNEILIKEYHRYCDEFETFKLRVANFIETQKNVFSISPEKLELSPLDLSSFEDYVLKNIADESQLGKDNGKNLDPVQNENAENEGDFPGSEDNGVKG